MGRLRIVAAAIVLAAALSAGPAGATAECAQRVIDDWSRGDLSAQYAPDCYAEALDHLPLDVAMYSTAPDDIARAQRAAVLRASGSRTLQAASTPRSGGSFPTKTVEIVAAVLAVAAGGAYVGYRRLRG
jgi:hypothetical protein